MQKDIKYEAPSLISRDASTAIKGLLMLLVAFGHTGLLTTNFTTGERTALWQWLYTFHVYVFFILPFIYGYKRRNCSTNDSWMGCSCILNDIIRNAIRVVIPYLWFSFIYLVVFIVAGGGKLDLGGIVYAITFGNEPLIGKYIGFNFLWYLPAYLALVTIISVWYNTHRSVRICLVAISLVLWLLYIVGMLNRYSVGMYVPFALSQGVYFMIYGLMSRWLIEKSLSVRKLLPCVILLIIGIAAGYAYYRKPLLEFGFNLFPAVNLIMPVLVFLLLYSIRESLAKSRVLKIIGQYSLQIYLIHVLIINALATGLLHFTHQSIVLGIVVYVTSILLSLAIAMLLDRIPWLNRILFPKTK